MKLAHYHNLMSCSTAKKKEINKIQKIITLATCSGHSICSQLCSLALCCSLPLTRNKRKMLTKRKCKMSMSSTVQFSVRIASQFLCFARRTQKCSRGGQRNDGTAHDASPTETETETEMEKDVSVAWTSGVEHMCVCV